jgi:hypothetical protein
MAHTIQTISCAPAEAAAMAADIGQHVVVLGLIANKAEIAKEFGNLLDHDDDVIALLVKTGKVAFFRTSLEDAETLYFDLQRNRTHVHPDSHVSAQFALYGPSGLIHHWLGHAAAPTALAA